MYVKPRARSIAYLRFYVLTHREDRRAATTPGGFLKRNRAPCGTVLLRGMRVFVRRIFNFKTNRHIKSPGFTPIYWHCVDYVSSEVTRNNPWIVRVSDAAFSVRDNVRKREKGASIQESLSFDKVEKYVRGNLDHSDTSLIYDLTLIWPNLNVTPHDLRLTILLFRQ